MDNDDNQHQVLNQLIAELGQLIQELKSGMPGCSRLGCMHRIAYNAKSDGSEQ